MTLRLDKDFQRNSWFKGILKERWHKVPLCCSSFVHFTEISKKEKQQAEMLALVLFLKHKTWHGMAEGVPISAHRHKKNDFLYHRTKHK